jgi:hypothetical protein
MQVFKKKAEASGGHVPLRGGKGISRNIFPSG